MTQAPARTPLPALRSGGRVRRLLLLLLSTATWFAALFVVGTGISPGVGEPTEREWPLQLLLVLAGIAIAALPVLVLALPAQRRVQHLVAAVLLPETVLPELPPMATWGGPERIFQRLRLTCYTVIAPPLLLLAGSGIAGFVLGEPVAGGVFSGLALVPLAFLWVTWSLPGRLRAGVEQGLAAGQVVPLRIVRRLDQRALLSGAYLSWFDGVLPDGRRVVVRTPLHHSWAPDARGVVDAPDLVLVIGRDGHQGLLLSPARPEDAVWLLGPVPLTRVPRLVQREFAADLPVLG